MVVFFSQEFAVASIRNNVTSRKFSQKALTGFIQTSNAI